MLQAQLTRQGWSADTMQALQRLLSPPQDSPIHAFHNIAPIQWLLQLLKKQQLLPDLAIFTGALTEQPKQKMFQVKSLQYS